MIEDLCDFLVKESFEIGYIAAVKKYKGGDYDVESAIKEARSEFKKYSLTMLMSELVKESPDEGYISLLKRMSSR